MSHEDPHMGEPESVNLNFFDPAIAPNPQPVWRNLVKLCPVGTPMPGGMLCISNYEDVMYALRNPQIFSSAMPFLTYMAPSLRKGSAFV